MSSDTPDDADVLVIRSGQISPGCLSADPVLQGRSEWQARWSHLDTPTLPRRTGFAPITPPTQTRNPLTSLDDGSYILFELDKREFANRLRIPEDSELLESLLDLPTKKYVGLVMGSFGGENESDATVYTIAFVSNSLPSSSGDSPEHDKFTVGIDPTKEGSWDMNVSPREPLRPNRFPWTGCYQYTVFGTRIVPTQIYPSAIKYGLQVDKIGFECPGCFDYFDGLASTDLECLRSEEEALVFDDIATAGTKIPFPVKVWQELNVESECHDPIGFMREALGIERPVIEALGGE